MASTETRRVAVDIETSSVGSQRRDVELFGHAIERAHHGTRDRNSVAAMGRDPFGALFAGIPDALDAGHPLGGTQAAHELVDRRLELREAAEGARIDREDRLARVGRAREILVEVDDVAAHRGAVERAREESHDEREAVTLVAPDRQKESLGGAPRIG